MESQCWTFALRRGISALLGTIMVDEEDVKWVLLNELQERLYDSESLSVLRNIA